MTLVSGRDDTPEGAGIVPAAQQSRTSRPQRPRPSADGSRQPPKARKQPATAAAARGTQSAAVIRATDGRSAAR